MAMIRLVVFVNSTIYIYSKPQNIVKNFNFVLTIFKQSYCALYALGVAQHLIHTKNTSSYADDGSGCSYIFDSLSVGCAGEI